MNTKRLIAGACVAGALTAATADVAAQQAEGFALNRFEPSERGSEWFVGESLDLREHQRFAAGLVLDYSYKPLAVYDPDTGDERSAIVAHQLFGHLGGTVILWDRARFGLSLPLAIFQDGETGRTANASFSSDNNTTIGDLRLGGDVRIVGRYEDPITFAAGLRLWAPTGSQDSFTGDGKVRLGPRAMVAGRVDSFVYSGQMHFTFRAQDQEFARSPTGSEVGMVTAAGLKTLDDKLVVGPELYWSTVVTDGDAFFARRTTPLELIIGGHYSATKEWRFGGGFGPGLTRGFGTPKVRVLLSAEWVQPVDDEPPPPKEKKEPGDRDGDGIIDDEDACPDEPGEPNDDPEKNGCPPPPDRDGDGIIDDEDACPDVPGEPNDDPEKNGCPPPGDRDGDGIIDPEDACPDEPGEPNEDPKKNGCPLPKDRDGDGILDEVDACPDTPGPENKDPKKHGCPVARIEGKRIIIREKVQFAYNSSKILQASDFILEAVAKILKDHEEIKKVHIQGHTDSKGSNAYNKRLSQRRAASVVRWLTKAGIKKDRLKPEGFGEEKPIDTNDTEEGRANNRRVEFHITEQSEPKTKEVVTAPDHRDPTKKKGPAPKDDKKK